MGFVAAAVLMLVGVFFFAIAIEGFSNNDTFDRFKAVGSAMVS
jgi:hypothetical protein